MFYSNFCEPRSPKDTNATNKHHMKSTGDCGEETDSKNVK